MTAEKARELKLKDRVIWDKDDEDKGTVIEIGYCAIKVEWDNGQIGITHFEDMKRITKESK